ncbi:melanoma-associated antigen 10-like [Arvicanthis niloticus]|uniref:melanoma-associated antigen 10-like n=1 Tax=Arvicanthis niloticus TaxID=61156 RepID=UPI0014864158|nr:melanoma-associated antigen 10-like [Arvicanthis niloticus]XP_034341797.1 melanoma-associated antigen 10-like [Arvicanthis niloticus]
MEPTENSQSFNLWDIPQEQIEERGPGDDQGPIAEAGEVETIAAISGDESAGEAPSSPQGAQSVSTPPTDMGSVAQAPSDNPLEEMPDTEFPSQGELNEKIIDLVRFLLVKFRRMELTNKEEMMQRALRDYEEHYSVIFSKAAECMKLIFGVDMLEVDPFVHSYFLYPALGITYDGMLHGVIGVPKTGLVIIVLCVIFIENNCVSEEVFWYAMNNLGMYAGVDHFIFGDLRSLITEDFVEEGYVEYRQVPNSQPPRFEFLWGPRAYAETTKMKILEFYASIVRQDPRSYPEKYAEALREEQERA